MDRRYEAYQHLLTASSKMQVDSDAADIALRAQALLEGRHAEFWQIMKTEIDQQIRAAEARFLDTLAKDYESYVAWWNRRQALIGVLAIPETVPRKE